MDAILWYVLFSGVVVLGVATAMGAGYPAGPVAVRYRLQQRRPD